MSDKRRSVKTIWPGEGGERHPPHSQGLLFSGVQVQLLIHSSWGDHQMKPLNRFQNAVSLTVKRQGKRQWDTEYLPVISSACPAWSKISVQWSMIVKQISWKDNEPYLDWFLEFFQFKSISRLNKTVYNF